MAEKENKQKHKSTIDKYFDRTAKAYKTWCDENEEERNFLQIAAEDNWDVSKVAKVSISILHIPENPISSQVDLCIQ